MMFKATPGTFRSLRQIAESHADSKSFSETGAYVAPPLAKDSGVGLARAVARPAPPRPAPFTAVREK